MGIQQGREEETIRVAGLGIRILMEVIICIVLGNYRNKKAADKEVQKDLDPIS